MGAPGTGFKPEPKQCKKCGAFFHKRIRDSKSQWESRIYCSILCRNQDSEVTPLSERFWRFVGLRVENNCWEWNGSLDNSGYGTISTKYGEPPAKAHRVSWEIHFGAIPDGLVVLHACDNPRCVNPNHLMVGTQAANAVDMAKKGRINQKSLMNLHPGAKNFHGAGPNSVKEIMNGIRK